MKWWLQVQEWILAVIITFLIFAPLHFTVNRPSISFRLYLIADILIFQRRDLFLLSSKSSSFLCIVKVILLCISFPQLVSAAFNRILFYISYFIFKDDACHIIDKQNLFKALWYFCDFVFFSIVALKKVILFTVPKR